MVWVRREGILFAVVYADWVNSVLQYDAEATVFSEEFINCDFVSWVVVTTDGAKKCPAKSYPMSIRLIKRAVLYFVYFDHFRCVSAN